MKKLIILTMLIAASYSLHAVPQHTLKHILPGLNAVVKHAKNPAELPEIVQKYHKQAQENNYVIEFKEFVKLYEEVSKLQAKRAKRNI